MNALFKKRLLKNALGGGSQALAPALVQGFAGLDLGHGSHTKGAYPRWTSSHI
jgi:hypothetical protein